MGLGNYQLAVGQMITILLKNTGQKTLALAVFAIGIGLATGLDAQPVSKSLAAGHDSTAPITVTSDNVQYDTNGKTGTFIGNVLVIQGDDKMRSDQVRLVAGADGKLDLIYATGHVVLNTPTNETATGDNGFIRLGRASWN